jgi:cytochrome c-type biogenesis protein CcmE
LHFSGGVFFESKNNFVKPRHQRMVAIAAGVALIAIAAALVLNAFQGNVVFFFSPSQVAAKEAPLEKAFRVGGMVEKGSLKRQSDGLTVQFIVTDTAKSIPVTYTGILPDLFKEGKGVVAQGKLGPDGLFHASEVLAKHDENYMPPEAAHALSKAEAERAAKSVVTPGGAR